MIFNREIAYYLKNRHRKRGKRVLRSAGNATRSRENERKTRGGREIGVHDRGWKQIPAGNSAIRDK